MPKELVLINIYFTYLFLSWGLCHIFETLFSSLRADIASQVCGHIVQSIELFKDCPDNFLRHVCMAMVPSAYMPGDYICFEVSSVSYVIKII